MQAETQQGFAATIHLEVRRVQPCDFHEGIATGEDIPCDGYTISPNGFHPGCPECRDTPAIIEYQTVEG